MKPIIEYTMQECLNAIRSMTCDKLDNVYEYQLADRIEELIAARNKANFPTIDQAVKKRSPAHDERPVYSTAAPYQPGDKILG